MNDAALHHQSKISETLFGKHEYNIGGRRLTPLHPPPTVEAPTKQSASISLA